MFTSSSLRTPFAILLLACLAGPHVGRASAQFEVTPTFGIPGADEGSPFVVEGDTSNPVEVKALFVAANEEQPATLVITAKIAPGYHIYSTTQAAGGPGATIIKPEASAAYRLLGDFKPYPAPKTHIDNVVWDGLQIEEHMGVVAWVAPVELVAGVDPAALTLGGSVDLQACEENTCQPLSYQFEAKQGALPAALVSLLSPTGGATTDGSTVLQAGAINLANDTAPLAHAIDETPLLLILGAALLGGLILNLMPCVLPVIGLKVLSFAEQGGQARGKVLALNISYSAGLISVFLLLAGLASLAQFGLSDESLGWGELYTIAEFKIGMVVLVFAMALSFLGVWEIPIPGFAGVGKANDLQAKEGLGGAFFKGIFTTILATPCSGPFLGPVFGYTLAQDPEITFLIFLFVGLGMASPYLLIGLFPSLVSWLPKPGAWMETFKQIMGFVLMGTVVYLLSTLTRNLYLPMLTTLVAIGFACWWIGRTPITASSGKRKTAWIGGIAASVATGVLAFSMIVPSDKELPWKPYNEQSLAAAQASGKTVLVDFTADWCLTCKLNLKRAINTASVKEVVEANGVETLLADWTDRNDEIKHAIAALGSRSIPLLAIYPAGRHDSPILLRDLISQDQLLEALREAGATQANEQELEMPLIEFGDAMNGAPTRR